MKFLQDYNNLLLFFKGKLSMVRNSNGAKGLRSKNQTYRQEIDYEDLLLCQRPQHCFPKTPSHSYCSWFSFHL